MFQNLVTVTKKRNLLLCLFLSTISAFIWTGALLYSQNTLFNNDFWYPYRAHFFKGQGYGLESLISRSVLAGNRLRTDQFIIYQRVFSKNQILPKAINFDFRVKEDSFLDVIFNSDGETFEAIRLSRFSYYPSSIYKAHKDGNFIWKKPIKVKIPSGNFHSAKIQQSGDELVLYIDGKESLQEKGQLKEGHVGFEVYAGSEVKSPFYHLSDGKNVDAGFNFSKNFFKYFILNFFLITGILFLLAIPFRRNYLQRLKNLSFLLTGTGLLWFAFDFYYYSRIFVVWDFSKDATVLQEKFNKGFDYEQMRSVLFREWHLLLGGKYPYIHELAALNLQPEGYPRGHYCFQGKCSIIEKDKKLPIFQLQKKNRVRIKIVGGSLSAGAGVEEISQGYVERLYRSLEERFSKNLEIEVLSTYSEISDETLYEDIKHFTPDFIFLDYLITEVNDNDLEKFLKRMKGNSAEEILMRLPVHPVKIDEDLDSIKPFLSQGLVRKPKSDSEYFEFDPFLAEWQDQYKFIFIDPNEALLTKKAYDEGDIWWDYCHLTVYGNKLFADFLKDHFIKLIDQKYRPLKPSISKLSEQKFKE